MAGDKVGAVRGEENHRGGNLLHAAEPADGQTAQDFVCDLPVLHHLARRSLRRRCYVRSRRGWWWDLQPFAPFPAPATAASIRIARWLEVRCGRTGVLRLSRGLQLRRSCILTVALLLAAFAANVLEARRWLRRSRFRGCPGWRLHGRIGGHVGTLLAVTLAASARLIL